MTARGLKRAGCRGLAVCLLLLAVSPDAAGRERGHTAPDRVIVRFEEVAARHLCPDEKSLLRGLGLSNEEASLVAPSCGLSTHRVLKLDKGLTVTEALRRLQGHPLLDYAEPDHIGYGAVVPNDPGYANQWHHPRVRSPESWALTTGSTGVVVAVLDTGVNTALSEFAGRTVPGYDFVNDDSDPSDDHGHGTAVAGVICANADNGVLVAGMDWQCKLMPVKVLDHRNEGFYSDWADGVNWAVEHGARIINLSAGGSLTDTTLAAAISNAVSRGVVFITATHNDGKKKVAYPGSLPTTIAVGNSGTNDVLYSTSNYGPEMDLVAPGEIIATVSANGGLVGGTGTSFSSAVVAGVAALVCAERPGLGNEQLRKILRAAAEDEVGNWRDKPGFDIYYGWGRLNAYNTLLLAGLHCVSVEAAPGGGLTVAWDAPANAAQKQPFGMSFADSPGGPWTRLLNPSNVIYTPTQARWTDDGSETGSAPSGTAQRIYRPFVK